MSEPTFKDVAPEDVLRIEQENGLAPKGTEPKILEEALEDEQRTAFEDIMSADQGFKVYAVLNEVKNQLYRVMSITEPAISHSTEQLALSCFGLISEIVEGSVEKIEGFINNVTVDGEPINER
jgi:hypothetical protein